MSKKTSFLLLLIAIIAVGSFFRFTNLGNIIFYGDEPLHQIRISYQPFPFVLAHNNGSALFSLLVHFLLPLGKLEVMARLPSALFGVLAIIAIYFLGAALLSKKEGLIAAAFVTFSPFFIRYSQHSRAYAMFLLLSLLSLYFFYRAITERKTWHWILFSFIALAGIYTHFMVFLLLPSFALFAGIGWLNGWRKRKKDAALWNAEKDTLGKFIFWTSLVLVLAFLLYLPNAYFYGFLSDSATRAKAEPVSTSMFFSLIHDILNTQMASPASFFFYAFLLFCIVGLTAGFRKRPRETLLASLYVLLPYFIFVAIRPREVNVLSADRYFIFMLPLVFLFASSGIVHSSSFVSSFLTKLKFLKGRAGLINNLIHGILVVLVVLGVSRGLRDYYMEYWRLGSFKPDKEVAEFLKRNVKRDALIYFDFFPVSSQITLINPLSRDLKVEEIEFVAREGYEPTGEAHDFMVYRIGSMEYGTYVAFYNTDLWAVTRLETKNREKLQAIMAEYPEARVHHLGTYTVIQFARNGESLREKLANMAGVFLSLDVDEQRERHFHLLASKAYLTVFGFEEGFRELETFRKMTLASEDAGRERVPSLIKMMDKIFGLSSRELRYISEKRMLSEVQQLLFLHGNSFFNAGEVEKALFAYSECSKLGEEYNQRISGKLAVLARQLAEEEETDKSLSLLEKAVQLDPSRRDINLLLAANWRKKGDLRRAEDMYKKAFSLASLPPEFFLALEDSSLAVLIWETDSAWHVLFRSEGETDFSGSFTSSGKIGELDKFALRPEDTLAVSGEKGRFSLQTRKGQPKALRIEALKKSRMTFDIKINGKRNSERIKVLGSGQASGKSYD